MSIDGRSMVLDVSGLGVVFYAPFAVSHIAEGADYLSSNYTTEEQVQAHIQQGSLVGFGTGSPGTFVLRFFEGYPTESHLRDCEFKLRLGLDCRGGQVCFRDLYDLLNWRASCDPEQVLELKDGFYHVTLCSDLPSSGVIGDNQEIQVYLQELEQFPQLSKHGIPTLCL